MEIIKSQARKNSRCIDWIKRGWWYGVLLVALQSCSTTKSIPEGDLLYTGAKIKFKSDQDKKFLKRIQSDLDKQIKPKPNKAIFGFPLKLAIYNGIQPQKPKGLKATLRKKLGEPPVLYSTVNPSFTKEVLSSTLFNRGFYHNIVSYSEVQEGKTMRVEYTIQTGPSYRIGEYVIQTSDEQVNQLAKASKPKPALKKGRRYNLEKLKDERERVDKELKNNGYYFFGPDYLLFKVDSLEQTRDVNLQLVLKPDVPQKALRRYTIAKTTVVMDSASVYDTTMITRDTLLVDGVHINVSKSFKPKAITRYVYMQEGDYYSREEHQLTLNRLMGMGLFKYVNLRVSEKDSSHLDVHIFLTALPKKSISAEVQAVTKSNNFVGPRLNLMYSNRNLLKGGERLSLNFHGSVETQLNGQFKGLYTYEVGPTVALSVPHFIVPFYIKPSNLYTPTTVFSVDYDFTRRVNYFDMSSLKFAFKYKWRESVTKDHELAPVNINIFSIRNLSTDFNELLQKDLSMKRRYDDQLIAGSSYSYTYNEQPIPNKKDQLYFNGNVDVAGNTMALLGNLVGTGNTNGAKTIGGIAYAQFARLDVDFRNYFHINRKTQLVNRVVVGWGIPYGNSTALPYVKSFFAGGANSVRAFSVNSLGPGTYRLPDSLQSSYFLQQGGDIKLELNVEYRFPIVKILKGAFFADAGNTWLAKANPALPGGQFEWRNAFREMGVGAGVGLRLDITFFVIRLDVATPLRKPWLAPESRWVAQQFDLSNKAWRRDNLLFNIAIGYPF